MKNSIAKLGLASFLTLSASIGAPATMYKEGIKLAPYYDRVGQKTTWCVGETEVGYKKKFTYEECSLLYHIRYGYYSMRVANMYSPRGKEVVTPEAHAALTDMAYNIGIAGVEKSSMMKRINTGDVAGACNAILLYKYAGGMDCSKPGNRECPGIWTRRKEMNALCLKGTQ